MSLLGLSLSFIEANVWRSSFLGFLEKKLDSEMKEEAGEGRRLRYHAPLRISKRGQSSRFAQIVASELGKKWIVS